MNMTDKLKFPYIWMDGKYVKWNQAKVHILTHALHYGTAIFEGMRCYQTQKGPAIFRLNEHLQRMYDGLRIYDLPITYSYDKYRKAVINTLKKNKAKECYIRPIAYLGYKKIGLDKTGIPLSMAIIPVHFPKYYGKKSETGLKMIVSSWRRIRSTILSPHVKASANYLNSVLAKAEAREDGHDEAVMLNAEGHVAEASADNIFIYETDTLYTPPLYDGALGGITRDSVIQLAKYLEIPIKEKTILRDELYTAEEVFVTGTAAEIVHTRSIDGRQIGNGKKGRITEKLQKLFQEVVRGRVKKFDKWLTYY